jgi:hypothetical protein
VLAAARMPTVRQLRVRPDLDVCERECVFLARCEAAASESSSLAVFLLL